jgi:hypothetical protein
MAREEKAESERIALAKAEQERRETALANAQAREIAQRERSAEIGRQVRDRTLSDLRLHATQQERRHRELDSALRHNARQQYAQTLMGELEAMINPPAPEPDEPVIEDEPGSTFGTADFNVEAWSKKRRSWW